MPNLMGKVPFFWNAVVFRHSEQKTQYPLNLNDVYCHSSDAEHTPGEVNPAHYSYHSSSNLIPKWSSNIMKRKKHRHCWVFSFETKCSSNQGCDLRALSLLKLILVKARQVMCLVMMKRWWRGRTLIDLFWWQGFRRAAKSRTGEEL